MLSLPHSFGDIYLGETFSCYVSLCSTSPVALENVGLKVEVQTQLQRETITDSSVAKGVKRLEPRETLDSIVEYELKDCGIHILLCTALYGDGKYLTKFFKFQVHNPLSLKSKTHVLAPQQEVIVETQVQNATARMLFLESVRFTPSPQFELVPFRRRATVEETAQGKSEIDEELESREDGYETSSGEALAPRAKLGTMAYLKAGDVQQYMFRLRGKLPAAQLKRVSALGRMDVAWKSGMGEAGHLQSNTVQRKLPAPRPLEISVISLPHEVTLHTPFEVCCSICNSSTKEQNLQLRFENSPEKASGFVIDGVSGRTLGKLKPYIVANVTFSAIALEPGVQKLQGLKFYDTLSKQSFDPGPLADILVMPKPPSPAAV